MSEIVEHQAMLSTISKIKFNNLLNFSFLLLIRLFKLSYKYLNKNNKIDKYLSIKV